MSRKRFNATRYSPWIASIGLFVLWEVLVRGLRVPVVWWVWRLGWA